MELHPRSSIDDARALQAGIASALPVVTDISQLPSSSSVPRSPLQPPPASSYPPISSIPQTSPSRLYRPERPDSPTVLYLAYGSNLAASTFLGTRGIRPVSRVNVSAPTLDLTFDLPGVPYNEPCFANTVVRKVPDKPPAPPKWPNPLDPSSLPTPPPDGHDGKPDKPDKKAAWDKGLIGVVYEVNRKDYAHIIETEGGGASYLDITVPCFALPIKYPTPGNPELPTPFFAHTLFAPHVPGPDGDGQGDDSKMKRKKPWYSRLITPRRRDTCQPSTRYLGLLKAGARDHDLPADWQAYLAGMTPYTRTSRRQEIGRYLWGAIFLPFIVMFAILLPKLIRLSRRLRGVPDEGKAPKWLAVVVVVLMNLSWLSYDSWGAGLFGDGEKTEQGEKDVEKCGYKWQVCCRQGDQVGGGDGDIYPDEKAGLMR